MTDLHTLAGAYVLDAVDDVERAAFRRHLAECEACAQEVAELQETAGRLTDLTYQIPPPTMREEVLAKVSRTPQVRAGGPSRVDAPARPWRRRAALTLAAGIIIGAVGAGTYVLQEQRVRDERERVEAAEERAEQIDAVLSAPDASLVRGPATGSGTVTVIGSRQLDQAVVVLELPTPDADQAYELWLGRGGALTSAGVLPAREGSATALVDELGSADLVGVSLEPAGGSPTGQPTPDQIVATVALA
jgi:anti-sigma-K factor RskA